MSKRELIDAIRQHNRTVPPEFLAACGERFAGVPGPGVHDLDGPDGDCAGAHGDAKRTGCRVISEI